MAAATALFSSCKTGSQTGNDAQAASPNTENTMDKEILTLTDSQQTLIQHNNNFALKLFRQTNGFDSRITSPLSVTYLMGILANGATGTTQAEILKTLGMEDASTNDLNTLCHALMQYAIKADKSTRVSIANYVAMNQDFAVRESFEKEVTKMYDAKVESLNFSAQGATAHINNWCKKHTEGLIPSIIDSVDPAAVSYLMNAIYFKGAWKNKFLKEETREENFRGYTRDIRRVNMMHLQNKFFYGTIQGASAINLPYGNGTYLMTVLLPDEGHSISEMLDSLSAESLTALDNSMTRCTVDLKLPRFTTETQTPLNGIIATLGAPSMFSAQTARFDNFATGDNFFVSKMFQKAKIEVNEKGSEAAAVTVAQVALTSLVHEEPEIVEFHANRPFVYLIRERSSGAILFIGQYTGQ